MKVSVIIPVYNEEKVIGDCLESLNRQTKKSEIILVDDGSTDNSIINIQNANTQFEIQKLILLEQKHLGPGAARNLGAKEAKGEILVFVDSDMTFTPDFIENLIKPIEKGESKGTFTKEEYVANWNNVWARCWNYNQGIGDNRRLPQSYSDTAPVYRAILKKEFDRVGGFTEGIGWTDDWSLAEKLGYQATSTNAVCYHNNPETLTEVWHQSRWIGKNKFISGSPLRILFNTMRYSLPVAFIFGIGKSLFYKTPGFIVFKLLYNAGLSFGMLEVLAGQHRYK